MRTAAETPLIIYEQIPLFCATANKSSKPQYKDIFSYAIFSTLKPYNLKIAL